MVPWVVNVALAIVLLWLLFRRRKLRWPVIAKQGLAVDDAVSVLAGLRETDPATGAVGRWQQGTLTLAEGAYLWTPGGSATAQRLGDFEVESVRLSGLAEGVWSLQIDWLVLTCARDAGHLEIATTRESLRKFPSLAPHAEGPARTR